MKGKKTVTDNYRQISLLSFPSKVMEKIVRKVMTDHLVKYKLIVEKQQGFDTNKSCLTNLLETIDTITEARNCGFLAAVVFMDFVKAFDRVCHRALIRKLEAYGFHGTYQVEYRRVRSWVHFSS